MAVAWGWFLIASAEKSKISSNGAMGLITVETSQTYFNKMKLFKERKWLHLEIHY